MSSYTQKVTNIIIALLNEVNVEYHNRIVKLLFIHLGYRFNLSFQLPVEVQNNYRMFVTKIKTN